MRGLIESAAPAKALFGRFGVTASALQVAIALAGAATMAAIAAGLVLAPPHPYIGAHLYDLYARALIDGRFDLPAMDLRYEGHFAPDGKGYLYHGLAPLLTRLPFLPFVEMPTLWISSASIWFWAVIGNVAFHRVFFLALARGAGGAANIGRLPAAALAAAVWFGSPGFLLVGSGAVFFEPISLAYALGGIFVLLVAKVAWGELALERALVPLAIAAGLTLHARPHLAVGYYAAVCLLLLALIRVRSVQAWKRPALALGILVCSGLVLLGSNALRFGNASAVHGSFSKAEVQYASIFWGLEHEDSPRARAFREHGQFNVTRVLPNALIYIASPPSGMGLDAAIDSLERWHARSIAETDFVTINEPKVGTLFLWPAWMLLMGLGLARRTLWRMPVLAGLAGVAVGSLLMLSYPTIALRYHVDLWPMIALPAVFGLERLASRLVRKGKSSGVWRSVLLVLLGVGFVATVQKTLHSRIMNVDSGAGWTTASCLALTENKGFEPARQSEICGSPASALGT